MMMRGGEKVKEFLRPFVDSKAWDFCIIWKLGDDPSSGGYIEKQIKQEEGKMASLLCRDEHKKHHIRSIACEALSHFPLFLPLYPGIHGEVVMLKSPKWLVNSAPGSNKDMFGTRVLVPVSDGLIELFSFIKKPFDESMVDLIVSHCKASSFEPFPQQTLQVETIPKEEESPMNLNGTSTVSSPSTETQNYRGKDVAVQNNVESKASKKLPKEHFKSKNLNSERRRRERINHNIYALRSVVPKVTKMNKVGTFSDAVDYINELLVEKQKLEDELNGINDEIVVQEESAIRNPEAEKVSAKKANDEVNLEVCEIREREFLIRVAQEYERDGFKKLLEAVDYCELEIIDANFTRLDLTVIALLSVKANRGGITSGNLRDFLLKTILTSNNP